MTDLVDLWHGPRRSLPVVVYNNISVDRQYPMPSDYGLDADGISRFLQDVENGKVK
jgi:hypothetical protein